jgi:hypothetical protein
VSVSEEGRAGAFLGVLVDVCSVPWWVPLLHCCPWTFFGEKSIWSVCRLSRQMQSRLMSVSSMIKAVAVALEN